MAVDFNGSNQYLNASGLTLGGADFSVACTVRIDSLVVGAGMLSAAGSANWFLQLGGAPVYPISFYGANAPSSPSTGALYRLVGTYTHSANTTRLYVGGVLTATSAPSISIASNSGMDVGRRGDGVYFDGMIAEVGVWKGLVLSAANAREYARGYTPDQIRPDKLAGYWELVEDDEYRDLAGGRTLTAFNSPDWRTHPRMIGRTRPQVGKTMLSMMAFTAQARGQHAFINSFTAQARGRYTLGLLSFIAQQRGQSAILNSLSATARGAHGVTAAFEAVARGYHKVGIETFAAEARGQSAIINSFDAELPGAHGVLTAFDATSGGRHTVYEAFDGQLPGQHAVFNAFTTTARGRHSVLMNVQTNFRGLHRLANDALARYELYRGIDALPELPPDEPTATPWETFTGSSHTTAALDPPLSGTRTYYFVLRQRNAYGLSSQNTAPWSVTIDDTGAIVATPPSAPIDVTLEPQASGVMRITARYLYTTDAPADRADRFAIWLTSDGSAPDPDNDPATATATYIQADGIGKLSYTTSGFADGTTIKAIVRMRRSGTPNIDSVNTAILEADAIAVGPDAVAGAGVFFGHVARQEQ